MKLSFIQVIGVNALSDSGFMQSRAASMDTVSYHKTFNQQRCLLPRVSEQFPFIILPVDMFIRYFCNVPLNDVKFVCGYVENMYVYTYVYKSTA